MSEVIIFAIFVLGVVAIVAITHRESRVAEQAVSGITEVAQNIAKRIPKK